MRLERGFCGLALARKLGVFSPKDFPGAMHLRAFFLIAFALAFARAAAAEPAFDVRTYPFSHYGSYMSVMLKTEEKSSREGLYIQDISGERMWGWKGVFRVEVMDEGKAVPYTVKATASQLTLTTSAGLLEICFQSPDVIRLRGNRLDVRLTQIIGSWSGANFPLNYQKTIWMCKMWGPHYAIAVTRGIPAGDAAATFVNEAIKDRPQFVLDVARDSSGRVDIAVEQFQDAYDGKQYDKPFEQCVADARQHFLEFCNKIPSTPAGYDDLRSLGAYVKWSSVVNPRSCIKRPCMYQSKNYMTAIWSWDNCFGAMATCNDHHFALDQLLVLFDYQTDLGILPDFLTEKYPMYAAFKPPVQGFTMMKMAELSHRAFSAADLAAVYGPIGKLTNFWLTYMDNNHNGIPQYNNSNDCADNCAVFQVGYPTEMADLCTYLIIQMDFLSEAACVLGKKDEAADWSSRAGRLLTAMQDSLWTEGRFVAKNSFTGEYCKDCNSFVNYIPVMLGNRLRKEIKGKLLSDLRTGGILTPYGPASEHPKSPYFIEDGYWRGAIWAPQYLFLVEGLKNCGEREWAKQLAQNYCEMCRTFGFPENFSALDGHPMRDTAYSWTVDVFFILAHEYLD